MQLAQALPFPFPKSDSTKTSKGLKHQSVYWIVANQKHVYRIAAPLREKRIVKKE